MDEREPDRDPPASYPIPEAIVAGDPGVLAGILAAIVGALFFWRRKNRVDPDDVWASGDETSQ
ncbi:MAG TPA: LPXTG cell wall anchor domain-containing protein [Micromonosporaceae bacterium]|jgi:LPXTG-motif cell wall-anchored protein